MDQCQVPVALDCNRPGQGKLQATTSEVQAGKSELKSNGSTCKILPSLDRGDGIMLAPARRRRRRRQWRWRRCRRRRRWELRHGRGGGAVRAATQMEIRRPDAVAMWPNLESEGFRLHLANRMCDQCSVGVGNEQPTRKAEALNCLHSPGLLVLA